MAALLASAAVARGADQRADTAAVGPDELRNIFTLQVENDVFNRIGKSTATIPTASASAGCRRRCPTCRPAWWRSPPSRPSSASGRRSVARRFGISIGQNIYTPQDTDDRAPIRNDRPYAAWLYASFALQ